MPTGWKKLISGRQPKDSSSHSAQWSAGGPEPALNAAQSASRRCAYSFAASLLAGEVASLVTGYSCSGGSSK
jgi:hypothetical protein